MLFRSKQSLIGNGHLFAMTKALSAFSEEGAVKELLEGESFVHWFGGLAEGYMEHATEHSETFAGLMAKAFAKNRVFVGYSGTLREEQIADLIEKLPENEMGAAASHPLSDKADSTIEIPAAVGYSALGDNVYSLGSGFSGHWAVLSSLMSFGYLWNMIRDRKSVV